MTAKDNTRNIIDELTGVLAYLGDDYTLTGTECDPGDSAVRVIKRNSDDVLYIIAYSEPEDTEMRLYDENGNLVVQCSIYDRTFSNLTPKRVADAIRTLL